MQREGEYSRQDPISDLDMVKAYHQASKHHPAALASGPSSLDWANQPDPFRHYLGSMQIPLERNEDSIKMSYEGLFTAEKAAAQPLDKDSISWFFFHSLALSAKRRQGQASWSLRVNPSSGNLHPTEAYLVCSQMPGLSSPEGKGLVAHYTPQHHGLEVLSELDTEGLNPAMFELVLCSIPWREAWKYGVRSYRYCQLDLGHALAALAYAAAGLGWEFCLADQMSSKSLGELVPPLPTEAEAEHPECLLEVGPRCGEMGERNLEPAGWVGSPNRLSAKSLSWDLVEDMFAATQKPSTAASRLPRQTSGNSRWAHSYSQGPPLLSRVLRRRRSAQRMDRSACRLSSEDFFVMLKRTVNAPPFSAVPWSPLVHLALFVHRVEGLVPGLYLLARSNSSAGMIRSALGTDLLWERSPDYPKGLFLLKEGDIQAFSKDASCRQDLASDGSFCLAMLGDMRCLRDVGAWMYPRLFWECGMIGQALYLEAEAIGMGACGLGCFFDDMVHDMLELEGEDMADLYHFTVGSPLKDPRQQSSSAYQG
ncbi:MAG: Nitroreductase family protein [Methanosaeta sp. PtaU1.Bin028]|nr:MAG: Nitroreductase family protein [Methanosaeta sp. PtaU1.Bin028]